MVKVALHIAPLIQWRGGMIHELFKYKGSDLMCEAYRDIMLGNAGAKAFSMFIRSCAKPVMHKMALSSQF
eukprot:10950778-Karenia_brevis.AAC.1